MDKTKKETEANIIIGELKHKGFNEEETQKILSFAYNKSRKYNASSVKFKGYKKTEPKVEKTEVPEFIVSELNEE